MDSVAETSHSAQEEAATPQAIVLSRLERAHELQNDEDLNGATAELEAASAQAQATPYKIEFQTRIQLAIELSEAYMDAGELGKARHVLDTEAAFAEKIFQIMQASGTPAQKRAAAGGRIQIRDRARQVALLGTEAPEITVKHWIKGEAATLASLRGRVVLLEFWATWCKPCHEMFPKLRALDEKYRERGLEVVALTRHYLAQRGTAESEAEELELMRSMIENHGVEFRVGVAVDERLQEIYGANGLPTLAVIDRAGRVRYAYFGGGQDESFEELLNECLSEPV
jgi:thiol-disulfide isomerase/thioredoxin